jgi:uncharacterized alpha-E superfamily protein
MLARVGDSLYWIGRYLERAEHSARLLEVNLDLMLYQTADSVDASWRRLSAVLPVDIGADEAGDPAIVTRNVTHEPGNENSILNSVAAARENARKVREVITNDMWDQLNRLYLRLKPVHVTEIWETPQLGLYRSIREGIHLFQGITDATFVHGEGWAFLRLGRFIERSIATARLLDGHLSELPTEGADEQVSGSDVTWIGLLRSCTALEAYTKAYTADPRPRTIAEFLLLSREFPHSLRYSVDQACAAMSGIEAWTGARRANELARAAGRLRAQLEFTDVDDVLGGNADDYLTAIIMQCERIHELLYAHYVSYSIDEASVYT